MRCISMVRPLSRLEEYSLRNLPWYVAVALVVLVAAGCGGSLRALRPVKTVRVVLQVDKAKAPGWAHIDGASRNMLMVDARQTLMKRALSLPGVASPQIKIVGDDTLDVRLYGLKNAGAVAGKFLSSGSLEFYFLKEVESEKNPLGKWKMQEGPSGRDFIFTDRQGHSVSSKSEPSAVYTKVAGAPGVKPVIDGKDLLQTAKATLSSNRVVIEIEFTPDGARKFADFTADHVDEHLAIFFDGKLLTAPVVREPITNGKAEISGFSSLAEAREVADILNSGSLPVPLRVVPAH
jgi:preprotein translocase subunit SecD